MGTSQDVWGSQEANGMAGLKSLKIAASYCALPRITSWLLGPFASLFA